MQEKIVPFLHNINELITKANFAYLALLQTFIQIFLIL